MSKSNVIEERAHVKLGPKDCVLGLDIGGTKIAAGLVTRDGSLLGRMHRSPTPARGTSDRMWEVVVKVCEKALAASGNPKIKGIGVGCAGPMVWPDGVVSPLNITAWRGFPLQRRLKEHFPKIPVRVHNDAITMAAAEHWIGAARGLDHALGMVVSTGVGGGFIIGNQLVDGGLGNAGHIGHVVVDPTGPSCHCGGRGCLEAIARGPSTAGWAVEQGWTPHSKEASADAKTLASDARDGDEIAIAAFARSGEAVGIALASVTALLDLDIAVIGGGLVQSGPLLMAPMRRAFAYHAGLKFQKRLRIVPAELDQTAGIVGAASLIIKSSNYWNPRDE